MEFTDFLKNDKQWAQKKLNQDPEFFDKLSQGQSPMCLFVACSDSRISSEEMMGASPGDLFSLRNISNVISNDDLSGLAVIEYAVEYLKVPHIVVCGHYGCGGVKAAMSQSDHRTLNPWLRKIKDVYDIHKAELNSISDEHERYNRLVELNVFEQCRNLMKMNIIQRALVAGKLKIHGWVFDMKKGHIADLAYDMEQMQKDVMEVYNLLD